jgi:magnesium transporter
MKTYWNTNGGLTPLKEWEPNCWIQVTCPTDEDRQYLEETYNIPDYFMNDISDTDERARYEYDDGWMLIILRIPYVKEIRSRTPYTTVPLGIIHKRDVTITVCYYETNMMLDFVSYQQKRGEGFVDYVDMIFRLFLSSAVWYLKRLKQISTLIEKAKRNLDKEVNNESLIGL